MLDPDHARAIAETLVARGIAAGATAADAIYGGNRSSDVQVRMGEIENVGRSDSEEIGLRLFVGQRSATVASSDLSEESLQTLAERCLAMAREAPEDQFSGLAPDSLLERGALPPLDSFDPGDPDPTELKARALEAEAAALAVAGVTNSNGGSASASASVIALATSAGFGGAYRTSGFGISASVIAGAGADMQSDHGWHSARHLGDLEDAVAIGRRAGERAVARLSPAPPPGGAFPILFDPRVSSSLLGHFIAAISGAAIARKTSFLQDALSTAVFGEGVTIIDDPLRPRGLRSRPFDGEGVRVARAELVSGGMLNQWIADSAAARQLGIAPTGHAGRGGGASPANLYLAPGARTREELFAEFPEAILVTYLIGQGVNGVTGDYSRGAAGFMVRGGEIAEPVAGFTIAANLKQMFATLEPASDLELRRGIDAPTLLIPEMTVASA